MALYAAPRSNFLVGTPVVTEALLDAVVDTPQAAADDGLAPLLLPGQRPLDEGERGVAAADSLQRYPKGDGQGARHLGLRRLFAYARCP